MITIEPIEKPIIKEDAGLIRKIDVLRAIITCDEVGSDLTYLYKVVENMDSLTCGKCTHWNSETKGCKRNPSVEKWKENDSCSYADMRKE